MTERPCKFVGIVWVQAAALDDNKWRDIDDALRDGYNIVLSAGIVLTEDRDSVTIAQAVGLDDDGTIKDAMRVLVIPRKQIEEIHTLTEKLKMSRSEFDQLSQENRARTIAAGTELYDEEDVTPLRRRGIMS